MYLLHAQAPLKLFCCLGFKSIWEEEPGWPGRISAELTGSQFCASCAGTADTLWFGLWSQNCPVLQQLLPWEVSCSSFRSRPQLPTSFRINPDTSLWLQVDILKKKFLLLEIATELTEGIVNGKKLEVKSTLKQDSRIHITRASPLESKVLRSAFGQEKNQAQEGSGLDRSSDVGGAGTGEAQRPEHHGPEDLKHKKGWPHFQEIFMLAALRGEEVDTLKVTPV